MPRRFSNAEYRRRLCEATDGKIELVGKFKGMSVTTSHRCNNGHAFETKPSNLLYSKGNCRHCYKPKLRRTNKKYTEELHSIFGGRVIALEPYAGYTTKIKHRCTQCNNVWEVTPNNTLFGHGCPACACRRKGRYVGNYRTVKIGDTERAVQGYEDLAIEHMIHNLKVRPENIIVTTGEGKPTIPYVHNGKLRMYTPDIFYPPKNRIIEVKSLHTMGVTLMLRGDDRGHNTFDEVAAKAKACVDLEYDFTLMMFRERCQGARPIKVYKHWFTRGSDMFLDYLIEEGLI